MLFSSSRSRRAIGLLLIPAAGCTKIVDPALDPRAEPFSPPPVYARWWSMVESCSGFSASMAAVSWYQVPRSETVDTEGADATGYWSPASNRIVIAGKSVLVGSIVRHEMLHALLRQTHGHPREYFLGRCGGAVACGATCLADAGPAASHALIKSIDASGLTLAVSLIPESPKSAVDGGFFTLVVTATNPRPDSVSVQLTQGPSHTFGYMLSGVGPSRQAWAPILDFGVRYFAPGETKRQYFDFVIGSGAGEEIIPGVYRVTGVYDLSTLTAANVTIGP